MHLRKTFEDVRASLWFVPAIATCASIALALFLVESQDDWGGVVTSAFPRLFSFNLEDARELLSSIATGVLTLAGVTFSLAAVTLSLLASAYTPRVVRSFMRSLRTQLTLGVLVGVYVYSFVVLRTLTGSPTQPVPELAVGVAQVYVTVGLAMFIVFTHHIASFIQSSTIISDVLEETFDAINDVFPHRREGSDDVRDEALERACADLVWHPVIAVKAGYIQDVDVGALVRYGRDKDTIVRLVARVGDFVAEGAPLLAVARVSPSARCVKRLRRAVSVGPHRTIEQDPAFGSRQIVDIALKGLSPAINDPTTAMICIDHLSALLHHLADRKVVEAHCCRSGKLRAIVPRARFEEILEGAVAPICFAGRDQPHVLERLLLMLQALARVVIPSSQMRAVHEQIAEVAAQVDRLLPVPGGARVVELAAKVRAEVVRSEMTRGRGEGLSAGDGDDPGQGEGLSAGHRDDLRQGEGLSTGHRDDLRQGEGLSAGHRDDLESGERPVGRASR